MKERTYFIGGLRKGVWVALLGLVALVSSCSMMEDDRSDCPAGLYVDFKYDYNIQQAEMFKDHVGGLTLYVFDSDGKLVASRSAENREGDAPLKEYGYRMHFADLPAGDYRLLALGGQRGYETLLKEPGAKFRRTELKPGDDMKSLQVTLDRADAPEASGRLAVDPSHPLDTLWHTLDATPVWSVDPMRPTYATVPLIRDTKNLDIVLRQTTDPAAISHDMYRVELTDRNGRLAYDNSLVEGDGTLLYTPYAAWTTAFPSGVEASAVTQRAAHYDLSFSRLMYHGEGDPKNALLTITNLRTGKTVARMDLPAILAEGRTAVETRRYSPQEFLDREYNYKLEFFLVGDRWSSVSLSISILSWAKRFQNEDLEFTF